MSFSLAFNADAGNGVIDPLRVSTSSSWGRTPDPLSADLIFSALYPATLCEEFAAASPDNPDGWQPRFTTTRAYATPPLVLAVHINASGERFYPGAFNALIKTGKDTYVSQYSYLTSYCKVATNKDGKFTVGANYTTTQYSGYFIRKGTLRLYVTGIG